MIAERHVEVSGCRLHTRLAGVAGALPVVVLESGGGSLLPTWRGIESALAPHTRVLSYERAGIGDSTGPAESVRPDAVANRLEQLLDATGIKGPVILAGHSLGGLYSRYFAATRPQQVMGVVLLDATPEEMPTSRLFFQLPGLILWPLHVLARLGLLQRLAPSASPEMLAAYRRFGHVRSFLKEVAALPEIQADIAALKTSSLPILAISAGAQPPPRQVRHRELFHRSHERLAATGQPPYSRHLRLAGADHMSILTGSQHAQSVAAEILAFARQVSSSRGA